MPAIQPLGDRAILVRFAETLSELANRQAIDFAARLESDPLEGVEEVAPGLVSVLVRTKADADFWRLSGELRLRMSELPPPPASVARPIPMVYDGEDLMDVCGRLRLAPGAFVVRHSGSPLRILATGFAPAFVYCGFHPPHMVVPRREQVRPMVPAGTVLFAAGQTAIAATPIRTGWHVIGRTAFQNFDPIADPPTKLSPGDIVQFTVAM
jgi:KipI family sensor histidine kinase inhibitor